MEQAENKQLPKHHQTASANSKIGETSTSCQDSSSGVHNKVQKPSSNKLVSSAVQRAESPPCSNKPHETVTNLLHTYPQLKIPRSCLKWNFMPAVTINKDDVTTWFVRKRKRDQAGEAQSNLSSKLLVKMVQNCDIATEHNSEKLKSQEDASKVAKRRLTSSEMPSAKRKVSETSEPRRKISSDALSNCSSDVGKDEPYGHSGLTEKEQPDASESALLSHINKSTNVNVCTVCNAVTYSNKEMKLHSRKHTVCPFCKVRFKTMDAKNTHVDKECPIKSIMQNMPTIPLVRAEKVKDLFKQYAYAFEAEVISSDDEDAEDNSEILIMDDSDDPLAISPIYKVKRTSKKQQKSVSSPIHSIKYETGSTESAMDSGQNNTIEQIDITLDDDDIMYISDDEIQPQSSNDVTSKEATNVVVSDLTDHAKQPQLKVEPLSDNPKSADNVIVTPNNTSKVEPAKPKKTSAKLPIFNITNDSYIKYVDTALSEVELIKTLLRETDKCPGVLPPTNKSIAIQGANDKIYALTNIVQYLRRYKIPVDLSFNSKLTVSYEPFKPPGPGKIEMWNPKMARTQRSMVPQSTVSNSNSTLPTTNVQTSPATSNQTLSVASNQRSLDDSTSTNSQPLSNTNNQPLPNTNNQPLPNTNNQPLSNTNSQALPTTNTQQVLIARNQTLSTTNSETICTKSNQTLLTTNHQTLASTIGQVLANSSTSNSASAALSAIAESATKHRPQHQTYVIERKNKKQVFQLTGGNNTTVTSNPLLNQSLDTPLLDNDVYSTSRFRNIEPTATVTSPATITPAITPTITPVATTTPGMFTISRPGSSVVIQGFQPMPNHFRPGAPLYTTILRPPPPNYRPLTINRFTNRLPTAPALGLRVKTAEELNKKF